MKKILTVLLSAVLSTSVFAAATGQFQYTIPQPDSITPYSGDDGGSVGGPGLGGGSQTPAPSIDAFTVDSSTITEGDTVTLSWTVSNANVVTLSEATLDAAGTDVSGQSSAQFTINTEGLYTFNLDVDGSVQNSVAVTVEAPVDPWSQTYVDPVLDGTWTEIANGSGATIDDSTWLTLRDNMSVGLLIQTSNGLTVFSPKDRLEAACVAINTVSTIQGNVMLVREDVGCNNSGNDYDAIPIGSGNVNPGAYTAGTLYTRASYYGYNTLFPNLSGQFDVGITKIYIK